MGELLETVELSEKEEQMVEASMGIIMHAGDSRLKITEALKYAKDFDFEKCAEAMKDAEKEITQAHNAQTEIIQAEASGDKYPHMLLFAHAQDTLMTINSELRMAEEMIDILKIIHDKLD